jgi:hypothetical protein
MIDVYLIYEYLLHATDVSGLRQTFQAYVKNRYY